MLREPGGGINMTGRLTEESPPLCAPARSREPAIEVVGGADQREVRERLGKVAQVLPRGPSSSE